MVYFGDRKTRDTAIQAKIQEVKDKIALLGSDVRKICKILRDEKDFYKKIVILENAPQEIYGEEWAEWLKKEFFKPRPDKSASVMGKYAALDTIDYSAEGSDDDPYGDAIIYALGKNGKGSEKALWEVFFHLYNAHRTSGTPSDMDGYDSDPKNYNDQMYGESDYVDDEEDLEDDEYKTLWDDDYFRETTLIGFAEKIGGEQSVENLIELVKQGGVEFLKEAIAEALSKIDPESAAEKLMALISNAANLDWLRRDAGKILYRLELGQIGISQDGVQYLGRQYDLGEFNDPDYFAYRLNPQGDVGVFNKERMLFGSFNLGSGLKT